MSEKPTEPTPDQPTQPQQPQGERQITISEPAQPGQGVVGGWIDGEAAQADDETEAETPAEPKGSKTKK